MTNCGLFSGQTFWIPVMRGAPEGGDSLPPDIQGHNRDQTLSNLMFLWPFVIGLCQPVWGTQSSKHSHEILCQKPRNLLDQKLCAFLIITKEPVQNPCYYLELHKHNSVNHRRNCWIKTCVFFFIETWLGQMYTQTSAVLYRKAGK